MTAIVVFLFIALIIAIINIIGLVVQNTLISQNKYKAELDSLNKYASEQKLDAEEDEFKNLKKQFDENILAATYDLEHAKETMENFVEGTEDYLKAYLDVKYNEGWLASFIFSQKTLESFIKEKKNE